MPYSDFTLDRIGQQLGVTNRVETLFNNVPELGYNPTLALDLQEAQQLRLRSEKAKSEWIVVPIVKELRRQNANYFTTFSGGNLEADPAKGLSGECDFLLAKGVHTYTISYPIIQVVGVKKNDSDIGVPQCGAQLIGAKLYNQQKGIPHDRLYGCVTTGINWRFLALDDALTIDDQPYSLTEVGKVLGVFQTILNYYRQLLA
jgi:hypothetical protein